MSHPIKEGVYWISLHNDVAKAERVAALHGNNLVKIFGDDLPVAFSYKIWRVMNSGHGYIFQNVATGKYAYAPDLSTNALVRLDDRKFTTFDIQPDGTGIWRVVVPDYNLGWTKLDLLGQKVPGCIKLSGSEGSDNQKFTFQPHAGP